MADLCQTAAGLPSGSLSVFHCVHSPHLLNPHGTCSREASRRSLYSASLWEFCLSFKALVCIKQRIATPKAEEKSPASQRVGRRLSVHMEIMVHTSVSPHTVCVYNVPPLVVHTSDESSSVNNKKGKHD